MVMLPKATLIILRSLKYQDVYKRQTLDLAKGYIKKEMNFIIRRRCLLLRRENRAIHKILNNINENVLEKYYSGTFFMLFMEERKHIKFQK